MILPKDGMQRELECSRLTVEHDWFQEDSDRIGDCVADASGAYQQSPFLRSDFLCTTLVVILHVAPDVFVVCRMFPKLCHAAPVLVSFG